MSNFPQNPPLIRAGSPAGATVFPHYIIASEASCSRENTCMHMAVIPHNPPLMCAGSPAGSTVFAPAAAPTGSTALQEGAMTLLTAANATARSVDTTTGLLVSASSLAATQASGTIYTNQVWGLVYLIFLMARLFTPVFAVPFAENHERLLFLFVYIWSYITHILSVMSFVVLWSFELILVLRQAGIKEQAPAAYCLTYYYCTV